MITLEKVPLNAIGAQCPGCDRHMLIGWRITTTGRNPDNEPIRCAQCTCEYIEGEQIIIGEY